MNLPVAPYDRGETDLPINGSTNKSINVTDSIVKKDQAEIVKLTLNLALVEKMMPDYNLIKDKENIVLSTENIVSKLVPKIPGINLLLLEPDQIQEKANNEGDFLYLRFKWLKSEGALLTVSIDNIWAVSRHSKVGYLSGGGFTIEFHKESGRWLSKILRSWVS